MKFIKNILIIFGISLQFSFAVLSDYSKISTEELKKTLIEAIEQSNECRVSNVLACPEAKNFDQYDLRKALELAAKNNHIDIARLLIQAGADVKDRYSRALVDAAEKGNLDMVKILLPVQGCDKHDYSLCFYADINYFNECRDEALIKAAKNGHGDVVKELINAGANVNYQNIFGNRAFIEAAKNGHVGVVKELLQAKVHVNAADGDGRTALDIAMFSRNVDLIRELLMTPEINVFRHMESIQSFYKEYLKRPELLKSFYKEEDEINLKIYELFKPFMKLKA